VPFELPAAAQWGERLGAVLHVLYLMFNEGYTSSGPELTRVDLSSEALRLVRMLHRLVPDDGEVMGLLALMLLTDARRAARTGPAGELIPLDEQDRGRWDRAAIGEGVALVTSALSRGAVGGISCRRRSRRARRGAERGGDGLAADPGAVRAAVADVGQPDGGAHHAIATDVAARGAWLEPAGRDRRAQRRAIVARERPDAVQRLVQRDAEPELIRARIDVGRAGVLLGSHVRRRPEGHPGDRHRAGGRRLDAVAISGRRRRRRGRDQREPEVADPDGAVAADQEVVGLDVAMHMPAAWAAARPAPTLRNTSTIERQSRARSASQARSDAPSTSSMAT
jgi:hypothetical protein